VIALQGIAGRIRPLVERLDALTLRERLIIFGAGVTLVYIAWQTLVMDPLAGRTRIAGQRLADVRRQISSIDELGASASQDPTVKAALRNDALAARVAALDGELGRVAQGYIAPERMTELLRSLLAEQQGLKLVSLANLPVESLSQPSGAKPDALLADDDRGPFLHPSKSWSRETTRAWWRTCALSRRCHGASTGASSSSPPGSIRRIGCGW